MASTIYGGLINREPITKGWSGDRKYCAEAANGTKYLLRVSPQEQSDKKKNEFIMMLRVSALGISMCHPVEIGSCDEGVYSLQKWIDGSDAEETIPTLSDTEQYAYGLDAGRILKTIHSIPAPEDLEDWETRFNRKIDRKLEMYSECPMIYENGQAFIDYIGENRHLLKNRPQCYQHGDYHIGNMMIGKDGKLYIIDFDRDDFGDPWEEFNRIVWCAQKTPLFASGMVNGYFDGDVPDEFWRLLALYISSNTLSSLPWAISFGQGEIDVMLNQAKEVLSWYDNMKNPVPTWYFKGYYLQYAGGIPYKLKSEFDFDFINKYGTVSKIFDDQDSGNICFGTEKNGERYFIKFAGAPTEQYTGNPSDAVSRLKATVPVYEALRHESLIEYIGSEEIGGGFAMVFKWADGECMGKMYPASRKKFMAMPIETKLAVFRDVLSFLEYSAAEGYIAVDFYDGSIMYDFDKKRTTVCDVDFFRKTPCVNDMGRMWGSSRFMSPEEFTLGAPFDEITNVYTIGALAFALFADCDRTREAWSLCDRLCSVATKAVSDNRSERQQSVRQFIDEWEEAERQS
ncbi:MAG: phosphotransferase [Eubacteriales bacterium]|nr:phosphotransferase [Eubacteriales bacterium]MDD4512964.1 phosphotransferase [Eubacteriales bacterium]